MEKKTNSDVKIGQYYILQSISPDSDICITREEIRQLSAIISGAWEISQMGEVSIRERERESSAVWRTQGCLAAWGKLKVWPNVTEIRRSLS